jgi:hypothetical protein
MKQVKLLIILLTFAFSAISGTATIGQYKINNEIMIAKPVFSQYQNNNQGFIKIYLKDNFTGESKIITEDWSPESYNDMVKWEGEIQSIRIPEGWSIRVYYYRGFGGDYLELSDDWTIHDNPEWEGEISSIRIIRKANLNKRKDRHHSSRGGRGYVKIYLKDNFTGESKIITEDWSPESYNDMVKWEGEIRSIRIPEGWSIRVYYYRGFGGDYLELSDDWTVYENPEWRGQISSIQIIRKPKNGH